MHPGPDRLVSGEGVAYELSRAGVGSRIVAAAIDLAIQFAALLLLLLLDGLLAGSADTDAVTAVLIVELVLVVAGYPIISEWLSRGRTIGKLCLGLRAVRDDGGPIGFRQALVRGLAGLILEKPGLLAPITTAIGVGTIAFSAEQKRLGDMMAGTFVLNERAAARRATQPHLFTVPYPLQPWAAALDLSRLDDQLALSVRQFLTRAATLTPAAQHALGESLRAQLLAVIAPAPPPGAPTGWVLASVLAERRRRSEIAMHRAATGNDAWLPQRPLPPAGVPPFFGGGTSPPARPADDPTTQPPSPFAPPG